MMVRVLYSCFSCNLDALAARRIFAYFLNHPVYVKIENTRCVELVFSLFASFGHKQKVYSYTSRQALAK